jgi:inorganic pyrophosphatase
MQRFGERAWVVMFVAVLSWPGPPPPILPADAATQLNLSLESAAPHAAHIWRDTPPFAANGLVNAYIEIPRDERRKFEFDMAANARAVDRVMPEALGGYPVNYGFVPQTVSYDGDPFDVLVLGPPLRGGSVVQGLIVGLMHMEDEKGVDSKVVLSPVDRSGRPIHQLEPADRRRMSDFFRRYKRHEPGKFSRVPGWDTAPQGRRYVETTHRFYRECREKPAGACRLSD